MLHLMNPHDADYVDALGDIVHSPPRRRQRLDDVIPLPDMDRPVPLADFDELIFV